MGKELAFMLILLAFCFSAYRVTGETEVVESFSAFAMHYAVVEDRYAVNLQVLLLVLILPILVVVMLILGMIAGGNNGSDSMRI